MTRSQIWPCAALFWFSLQLGWVEMCSYKQQFLNNHLNGQPCKMVVNSLMPCIPINTGIMLSCWFGSYKRAIKFPRK